MSYSPAASFLLFLVQWTDCSLAGALGLLRILIYKVLFCARVVSISQLMVSSADCASVLRESSCLNLCFGWFCVQVYVDGTTTMSTHERKASIREFYGKISHRSTVISLLTLT
jgi:hypothetical protein